MYFVKDIFVTLAIDISIYYLLHVKIRTVLTTRIIITMKTYFVCVMLHDALTHSDENKLVQLT